MKQIVGAGNRPQYLKKWQNFALWDFFSATFFFATVSVWKLATVEWRNKNFKTIALFCRFCNTSRRGYLEPLQVIQLIDSAQNFDNFFWRSKQWPLLLKILSECTLCSRELELNARRVCLCVWVREKECL